MPDNFPELESKPKSNTTPELMSEATLRPALMVQGTTSDAGKSVLVSGICRLLAKRGVCIAPFKPQNMALNSTVTADGGEIGRAQAVQAFACGIAPTTDMNPVLIKPNSDTAAQIIINGQVAFDMDAHVFHEHKPYILGEVLSAFERLQKSYDCVIIEGAGSPAEINLRDRDIANMGFAEAADVPVIIIADIDRGGVFAHLYGTLALLSASERDRVIGFVINRFRGDLSLLQSGLDWLEEKTGKPVLGVLPYLHGLHIDAEDAISATQILDEEKNTFRVLVPVFTRMSNHTDFDPLRLNPTIDFQFIGMGEHLDAADLIILPGTKSVRQDLAYLQSQGWDVDIARHLRFGGKVMGICGGYQMLGEWIDDPDGVEGTAGKSKGLGYLPMTTTLQKQKKLCQVSGTLTLPNQKGVEIKGYEIHAGSSTVMTDAPIILNNVHNNFDGGLDESNQVFGTYIHGLFDNPAALACLLHWAGMGKVKAVDTESLKDASITRVADAIEAHLDLSKMLHIEK